MLVFQKILLVGIALLISQSALGQALSEFCFRSPTQASEGINYASQILLKSEKFIHQPGQSCVQVYLEKESRFELIDLFIRRKFSLKSSSASMTLAHRSKNGSQHCRLFLEEVGHKNNNSNKIGIGTKSFVKSYGAKINDRFQTTVVMMSGKSAKVMTPDGEIKVTCQITNSGAANVTFSIQSKIASQVLIMPGQTFNIGSLAKKSQDYNKKFNLKNGVNFNQNEEASKTSYQIRYSKF